MIAFPQLAPGQRLRLAAVLAKAEPSFDGRLRGYRHTMLDDSDISPTRHPHGFVCGALAGLVGHAEIYVSGGAEYRGPSGGGPVAVIVSRCPLNRWPAAMTLDPLGTVGGRISVFFANNR